MSSSTTNGGSGNSPPPSARPPGYPYAPDLGPRSAQAAREAAQLLRGPLSAQAKELTAQGFHVLPPESLGYAATIFDNVQKMRGGLDLRQDVRPMERISIACALASAVEGFERECDLDAFGMWWTFSQTHPTIQQARTVLWLLNAGRRDEVAAWAEEDLARYKREQGENR